MIKVLSERFTDYGIHHNVESLNGVDFKIVIRYEDLYIPMTVLPSNVIQIFLDNNVKSFYKEFCMLYEAVDYIVSRQFLEDLK